MLCWFRSQLRFYRTVAYRSHHPITGQCCAHTKTSQTACRIATVLVTGISFPKKDAEFVARDRVAIQAKRALGAVNVKCSFRCCTEEGYYDGYQQRHFAP